MTSGTQNPTFVSTSLVDLPYEAVLEVTEVGELDVISRLALRHTCRRLFQFAGGRGYWLSAALMLCRQGLTPPVPLGYSSLTTLSMEQLMLSCLRCHSLDIRLQSPSPTYRQHYTLALPPDSQRVENFAFFQGGRFAMTTHYDGAARVWDLQPPEVQPGSPNGPIQIGDLLATKQIGQYIITVGYQTSCDSNNLSVLVSVLCYAPGPISTLHNFTITFLKHDDGRFGAHFSQDYQVGNVQGDPSPGVIAQDGLGIALVHSSEGKGVYLIVADSARRAHLTIETGLDTNKQWDVVVSGIAILLFSELANEVFFAVYSNLRALLPSSGGLAVERQPEITGLRTYGSPQDSLTEDLSWYTVHPWDTPHWQTDNLVPVLFEASRLDWEDDTEWRSIVGIHWLSPAQVIRSLESGEPMPRETRHIKHLRDECMQAELDGATMLVPSTYGRRLLWVNHPVEPDDYNPEPRLETITLQTPWRSTINENGSSTRFHVPLDLNLTHRIDFDDEHGRLLIITDPTGDEGYQTAHIFTY